MAKQFDGQHEGEEVLMVIRHHPVVMRKGLIAILVFLLFGMLPTLFWPADLRMLWGIPLSLIPGLLVFWYFWIGWYYSVYIMTDQRLIQVSQKGLFNRSVVDVGLDKIQSINYQVAGVQETLLGFGTILIQTYVGDLVMDKIHHPQDVQEEITKLMRELGVTGAVPPGLYASEEES